LTDKIWPSKPDEKDTTEKEKIIGYWGGSFGTRNDESNKNFITINNETKKIYTDKQIWKLNNEREKIIDSLILNCKIKDFTQQKK